MPDQSEYWSSRAGFIFAAMRSAIGLGRIWKFPYEVGTNGGGGFVFFYLLGLLLIVFPLMLVEFAIGRRGRSNAVTSIAAVALESGGSRMWATTGILGVAAAVLILSFYSVIGGWALAYVVDTIRHGLAGDAASLVQARYDALLASPVRMTIYHTIFMVITAVIVARGIAGGIESASLYLMPVLIVLIVTLAIYSTSQGDAVAALRFLFTVDLHRLSPKVALEALGLGFFSIGVGLAILITYAAYEMPVALAQRWLGWPRPNAALAAASACWVLGLASVLSFNAWSSWYPLARLPGLGTSTAFDYLDQVASNVLLPPAAFRLAIFGGWVVQATLLADELRLGGTASRMLSIVLRHVAPVGIAAASLAPFVL
jgi:SNF family Na+-dependent transporter